MTTWRVQRGGPLRGRIQLPVDLHVSQEALLWAALAEGPSHLRGLLAGSEQHALIAALRAMSVPIAHVDSGVRVQGVGLHGLKMPSGALSAGDSPSTLQLLAALLSGQRFGTRIEATGRAAQYGLRNLLEPLRGRGAQIAGRSNGEELCAPVGVAPLLAEEQLHEVEIEIPFGDATTKRGLLVSGLYARGVTAISEGMLSRDHTERALVALGLPVQTMGPFTLLDTSEQAPSWQGFEWDMPGDFSVATFLIAAALAVPESDILIENVGVNRSRTAWFDVLRHAGARIEVTPRGDVAGNEPIAAVRVRSSKLRTLRAGGELAQRMLDDVPAYAALLAAATGRVSLRDAGALRLRHGNPLKGAAQLLRSFGFECTDYDDGFDADPAGELQSVQLSAALLPELKLLGLVLGLCAAEPTQLHAADELDALYPGLRQALVALGANVRVDSPAEGHA